MTPPAHFTNPRGKKEKSVREREGGGFGKLKGLKWR
jgi:hypothetical protein